MEGDFSGLIGLNVVLKTDPKPEKARVFKVVGAYSVGSVPTLICLQTANGNLTARAMSEVKVVSTAPPALEPV